MLNSDLFNPADDMLTKRDVQLKTEDQETALAVQMVDEQVGFRRPTRSRKPTRMPRLGCARTAQHARRRCLTPRMQIRRVRAPETAPAPAPPPRRGTVTWCRRRRRAQPQQARLPLHLATVVVVPSLCRYDNVTHVIQG